MLDRLGDGCGLMRPPKPRPASFSPAAILAPHPGEDRTGSILL